MAIVSVLGIGAGGPPTVGLLLSGLFSADLQRLGRYPVAIRSRESKREALERALSSARRPAPTFTRTAPFSIKALDARFNAIEPRFDRLEELLKDR